MTVNPEIAKNTSCTYDASTAGFPSPLRGGQGGVQTGKELDDETGYSYFGARYYDPSISIWLSVDPLSDKNPNTSPYSYCINNPIRLVDPDGRDWYESESGAVIHQNNDAKKIKIDGETYRNIGKEYSAQMENGEYVNYYQNTPVSVGARESGTRRLARTPELRSKYLNNKSIPREYKTDIFMASMRNQGVEGADMIGVQLSGSAILGGGFTGSATFGYMDGEGWFASVSGGGGVGLDISASVGVVWGNYKASNKPSLGSLEGAYTYQGGGSILNGTVWQSYRGDAAHNPVVGDLWQGGSLNLSVGSKTLFGGSAGAGATKIWSW